MYLFNMVASILSGMTRTKLFPVYGLRAIKLMSDFRIISTEKVLILTKTIPTDMFSGKILLPSRIPIKAYVCKNAGITVVTMAGWLEKKVDISL